MLAPVPRRKLLTAPYLSPRFDVDAVQRLFDQLNPALCRIFVKSASPPSGIDYDQVEPYFGIDYRTRPFAPFLADVRIVLSRVRLLTFCGGSYSI
jgi:hypothetical protein